MSQLNMSQLSRFTAQSFTLSGVSALGAFMLAVSSLSPHFSSVANAEDAQPSEIVSKNNSETPRAKAADTALEVVVTAGRGLKQDPLEVPQSISTVTSQEIAEREYGDVEDIIRRVPGVGLAPAEGNPNYWQEGFTIRGLGAQRVLTLTDGIRQAGQGIGYGGGNLSLYDTLAIERIEILRGPASVLYGTDAFGGVVNVITREPTRRGKFGTGGAVRYGYDGQYDRNRAGGYLDFGDDAYAVVLGGNYTRANEPRLRDGEDPNQGSYRQVGLFGKADFFLTDDTTLRFIGNNTRNSDVLITRETITLPIATFPPPGASIPITSPLYFSFPLYQRSMAGVELTVDNVGADWQEFKTGLYWQQITREFYRTSAAYPQFSPGFAGPPLFFNPSATVIQERTRTDDEVNIFESQTQARFELGDHTLTVGLDLGYDDADLPETIETQVVAQAGLGPVMRPPTSVSRTRADADQFRAGLYAQDNWSLDQFEVVPGVRVDYFSVNDAITDFDDDLAGVSGSLGTVYKRTAEHSVYATVATGFRAPDLGERFQDGIVSLGVPSRVIGNPDIDPERSYTGEVGTKYITSDVSLELAGFATRVQDYIGRVPVGVIQGFSTEQIENVGDVSLYGFEFGSRARAWEVFDFYLNVARTWTNESEKIDVPGWIFNYGVAHNLEVGSSTLERVRTEVNLRTVGPSIDNTESPGRPNFPGQADFTVVDVGVNFYLSEMSFGKTTLIAGVKNLFDKDYREPFFEVLQPARNAFVAVQVDF